MALWAGAALRVSRRQKDLLIPSVGRIEFEVRLCLT